MMTPDEAAIALAKLRTQYDLVISGQAPNEIEADGYRMKTTPANIARLRARISELERIAASATGGWAIGVRF